MHGRRLLLAGDGELVECYTSSDLGVPMWEAHPWRSGRGDEDETVIAVGDGIIVERASCGGRRCREP